MSTLIPLCKDENCIAGVYILQNTMVGGGWLLGKKMKTEGVRKKRLINASLTVKNSKIFAGGGATVPFATPPPAVCRGFAPPGASGKKRCPKGGGGGMIEMYNIYPCNLVLLNIHYEDMRVRLQICFP